MDVITYPENPENNDTVAAVLTLFAAINVDPCSNHKTLLYSIELTTLPQEISDRFS